MMTLNKQTLLFLQTAKAPLNDVTIAVNITLKLRTTIRRYFLI